MEMTCQQIDAFLYLTSFKDDVMIFLSKQDIYSQRYFIMNNESLYIIIYQLNVSKIKTHENRNKPDFILKKVQVLSVYYYRWVLSKISDICEFK